MCIFVKVVLFILIYFLMPNNCYQLGGVLLLPSVDSNRCVSLFLQPLQHWVLGWKLLFYLIFRSITSVSTSLLGGWLISNTHLWKPFWITPFLLYLPASPNRWHPVGVLRVEIQGRRFPPWVQSKRRVSMNINTASWIMVTSTKRENIWHVRIPKDSLGKEALGESWWWCGTCPGERKCFPAEGGGGPRARRWGRGLTELGAGERGEVRVEPEAGARAWAWGGLVPGRQWEAHAHTAQVWGLYLDPRRVPWSHSGAWVTLWGRNLGSSEARDLKDVFHLGLQCHIARTLSASQPSHRAVDQHQMPHEWPQPSLVLGTGSAKQFRVLL